MNDPHDETDDGWPLGYVDDGVTNDEEYVPAYPEDDCGGDDDPEPQTEDEWIADNIY